MISEMIHSMFGKSKVGPSPALGFHTTRGEPGTDHVSADDYHPSTPHIVVGGEVQQYGGQHYLNPYRYQGYHAAGSGASIEHNPHDSSTVAHHDWNEGHMDHTFINKKP